MPADQSSGARPGAPAWLRPLRVTPASLWIRLRDWFFDYDLLFLAYVASAAASYFFESYQRGEGVFLYLVIPLAVLPSLVLLVARPAGLSERAAAEPLGRLFDVRRAWLFWAAAVYLVAITVPDLVRADVDGIAARIHAWQACEIGIFLAVTALLAVRYPDFVPRLILVLGALIAVSALANMINELSHVGRRALFLRFTPAFGLTDNRVATTAGLSYALAFVATATTALGPWRRLWPRVVAAISAFVILAALLWTHARGGYLAAGAGLAAAALAGRSRHQLVAVAVVLVAVVLFVAMAPQVGLHMISRGDSHRLEIWQAYVAFASDHPWLGYGQLANTHLQVGGLEFIHAHNLVLSAQVLGGFPAGAAMLFLLVGGIYWAARGRRASGGVTVLTLIAALAAGGMTDFALVTTYPDWYWAAIWLPIALCIGTECVLRQSRATALAPRRPAS